jgi:hypothetical protein
LLNNANITLESTRNRNKLEKNKHNKLRLKGEIENNQNLDKRAKKKILKIKRRIIKLQILYMIN